MFGPPSLPSLFEITTEHHKSYKIAAAIRELLCTCKVSILIFFNLFDVEFSGIGRQFLVVVVGAHWGVAIRAHIGVRERSCGGGGGTQRVGEVGLWLGLLLLLSILLWCWWDCEMCGFR